MTLCKIKMGLWKLSLRTCLIKYEIVQAIQRFRLEDLFEKSDMKMETWDLKVAKSWNAGKIRRIPAATAVLQATAKRSAEALETERVRD